MRDYQRNKLYTAEYAVARGRMLSIAACERFIRVVLKHAIPMFPAAKRHLENLKIVPVDRGTAWTEASTSTIRLPRWARTYFLMLHEIAHLLTPQRFSCHGKEYAATLLHLVEEWRGPRVAAKLQKAFDREEVEYLEAPKRR